MLERNHGTEVYAVLPASQITGRLLTRFSGKGRVTRSEAADRRSVARFLLWVICLALPLFTPADAGLDELVDLPVEYSRRIARLVVGSQVLDHLVRVQHVGTHLVSPR